MEWKPTYDKIIVKRDPPDEALGEGVVAAEAYKKQKNRGTVVAVGVGRICANGEILPLTLHVGDRVLFGQHSGIDVEESAKDHVMLREDEVLAYYRDEVG
jgi:chaperonin GroES